MAISAPNPQRGEANWMPKRPRRTILLAALAATALCAGLAVGGRVVVRWLDPFAAQQFDVAAWATADHEGRAAMTRDAIRHLPPGPPRAQNQGVARRAASYRGDTSVICL